MCVRVCARHISLDGEGNVLYPVLSSYYCYNVVYKIPGILSEYMYKATGALD